MDKPADKAREQMRSMGLSAPYIGSEETRTEEEIKADRRALAENIPILGEAILAKEIADDVKDENYLSAGLNTAALAVGAIPGVGKVASKPIRSLAKSVRKGYNPDDPASRVFHLTKTDFDAADVVGKGTNDIGFHVGTAAQANARGSTGIKYDKELAEKMVEKERVLPMVLKQTLKPARIIDVGSFKEPKNWIANLSVANKDKQLIKFLLDDPADADLLAKAPKVIVGGDTYFMLPDAMRSGIDENLWKDIILEAHRARRLGLDTINKQSDRVEWFDTLKQAANKNGYDSFVYKNEYEGAKELAKSASKGDSYMLLEPDQAKGLFGGMTEGNPAYMKNKGGLMLQSGGVVPMNNMAKQMEMFDEGGLMDEGGTVDPVSGNDVPPGSTQEEVRDDIPAQLSEGEFVFPADVVRFIGLEKLMKIRQRAKAGLQRMEDMGQMGNSEEAIMPDTLPFSIEDLDMEDEDEYNTPQEFNQGGMPVPDPNAGVYYNPALKPTTGVAPAPVTAASSNIARSIPIAQAATPMQAGSSNQPAMFNNYPLPQAPVPTMPQRDDLPPFLGGVVPGVEGIDRVKEIYQNEAGDTKTFFRYTDNRLLDENGAVAVIPEGYKLKSEAEKDVGTGPVKVESATVPEERGDDGQPDDGLGSSGARVAWGGTTKGARKGLKVGSTQLGISYNKVDPVTGKPVMGLSSLSAAKDMTSLLASLTLGGELPSDYTAVATLDNVMTSISNKDFNAAKKAGYMGQNADATLDVVNRNVTAANILEDKFGLRARTQPTTVENIAQEAMKTQAGIEQIAKDYGLNAVGMSYKDGLRSITTIVNDRNRIAYKADNRLSEAKDFSTDDILAGGAARAAIDAQNDAVNAKAAAQRAADRDEGGGVGPGGPGDTGKGGTGGTGVDDTGTSTGFGSEEDCLTEDMKVNLNGVIDFVTNIKVGDTIDNYRVKEVLHKHMRNGYYAINNELKISNDHPVLANGAWTRPEDLVVGDSINGIPVSSLEYVEQLTPTVSIVIDGESFDVHTENNIYTVHGRYREVRQEAA